VRATVTVLPLPALRSRCRPYEEGTEAAAVTSVEMKVESVSETFNMIVDRPFFLVTRDDETGTILFMGSILEPIV